MQGLWNRPGKCSSLCCACCPLTLGMMDWLTAVLPQLNVHTLATSYTGYTCLATSLCLPTNRHASLDCDRRKGLADGRAQEGCQPLAAAPGGLQHIMQVIRAHPAMGVHRQYPRRAAAVACWVCVRRRGKGEGTAPRRNSRLRTKRGWVGGEALQA